MLIVRIQHRNDNPNTIYNVLKRKLDREPTNAELKAEVLRILREARETEQ